MELVEFQWSLVIMFRWLSVKLQKMPMPRACCYFWIFFKSMQFLSQRYRPIILVSAKRIAVVWLAEEINYGAKYLSHSGVRAGATLRAVAGPGRPVIRTALQVVTASVANLHSKPAPATMFAELSHLKEIRKHFRLLCSLCCFVSFFFVLQIKWTHAKKYMSSITCPKASRRLFN